VVRQGAGLVRLDGILADGAFDSDANHRLCREELRIPRSIIPYNDRGLPSARPTSRYRRQMKDRFPKRLYRRRAHVESSFSMDKRTLGSALRAKHAKGREAEMCLRVLTHNLKIIRRFR
jgi:hypothetical protein